MPTHVIQNYLSDSFTDKIGLPQITGVRHNKIYPVEVFYDRRMQR